MKMCYSVPVRVQEWLFGVDVQRKDTSLTDRDKVTCHKIVFAV